MLLGCLRCGTLLLRECLCVQAVSVASGPKLYRCDIGRNYAHVLLLMLLLLKFHAGRVIAIISLSRQLAHTTSYWLLELTLR